MKNNKDQQLVVAMWANRRFERVTVALQGTPPVEIKSLIPRAFHRERLSRYCHIAVPNSPNYDQ